MPKKYCVQLQPQQRMTLQQMLRRGKHSARQLAHVRVLLKADEGLSDTQIVAAVGVYRPRRTGRCPALHDDHDLVLSIRESDRQVPAEVTDPR